ncbi:MAG: hypothetical protein ACU84Q_12605 [Gammaproteobacteria bacterium]
MKKLLPAVALSISIASSSVCHAENETTQKIMWQLYDAIAYLLPLSVREDASFSNDDKQLIDKHLADLRAGSSQLAKHGASRGTNFELLANSFNELTKDIEDGFRGKWPGYSYHSLSELTQHCVACHARLPAESVPALGQKILARINTDDFATWNLVNLLIATREFDAAMSKLEKALLDPLTPASELEYSGQLITYLRVAINVDADVQRPHDFFSKFLQREDLPYYLSFRIRHWQKDLMALGKFLKQPPVLSDAKQILADADDITEVPGDAVRAVSDLVAAAIMQQLVDSDNQLTPTETAEAYFYLGVIALRTFELDFSVPELEYLFIAAIKADPNGPFAAKAYRYLEEFGYLEDPDAPAGTGPLVQRTVDLTELRKQAGISE